MRDGTKTKKLIDQTALKLFVDQGVTGTTVRDIAAAARIAEGTLYRHYPGKSELAWELFSKNFVDLTLKLELLQQGRRTLKGKIQAMVSRFCGFFDEDPVLFSYLLLTQHRQLRRLTPDMPHPVTLLRQVIAGGMERGEIPPGDSNVAAAMVLGLVLQVAVFKVYGTIDQSLTSLAPTLVDAAWRVLRVDFA
jgi:AcrR family transcriptional regulator